MTGSEKPPYEKPDAVPLGGEGRLNDEQADGIVGGGSGAADCMTGDVAFTNNCENGPLAQS